MKVSINTVTGLLVESSSTSSAETLLENAIGAGIPASDVEVRDVDETEHSRLIAARDALNTTLDQRARKARADRDALISACDWTVLPDAPLTAAQQTAWKTYRQALRDISVQPGFPATINWPVAP